MHAAVQQHHSCAREDGGWSGAAPDLCGKLGAFDLQM
jgi:hypothetical protein